MPVSRRVVMHVHWPPRRRYKVVVPTEIIRAMAAEIGIPDDTIRDELASRTPLGQLLARIGFEESRRERVS